MSDDPGDDEGPSFEERLKAARSRQGLDAPPKAPGLSPGDFGPSPWGIGLRVGVELVSALVVAVAIGYGLSLLFGARPLFIAVFGIPRRRGGRAEYLAHVRAGERQVDAEAD